MHNYLCQAGGGVEEVRGAEARELILLTPLWKLKSIISQSDQRLCFHTSLYLFGYNKCRCKTKVLPISQGKRKARVWCFLIETKSLFRVDQRRPVMGLIVHGEVNKHHGNISFVHLPSQERTFKIWSKRFQFDGGVAKVVVAPPTATPPAKARLVTSPLSSSLSDWSPTGHAVVNQTRRVRTSGGARSAAAMTSSQALHETSIKGKTFRQRSGDMMMWTRTRQTIAPIEPPAIAREQRPHSEASAGLFTQNDINLPNCFNSAASRLLHLPRTHR